MLNSIRFFIKKHFYKIINSIAFYPAFIGILFLVLAAFLLRFDYSETGKLLKTNLTWLQLKDSSTARTIISAIAAGIISLTVFSFSMVMIVLNQAASQMSNRVLDKLIGNRFQQIVLGVYIGTIVYALFLLSTIRDIKDGIYIPALSIFLLMLITIIDIFIFIYFLHYITQSVKYEVIIQRIYSDTRNSLQHNCRLTSEQQQPVSTATLFPITAERSGIYENFDKEKLLKICANYSCTLSLAHIPGTFILPGTPIIFCDKEIPPEAVDAINKAVYLRMSENITENYLYGLRQLTEVAIKALSPGINDPGTAIVSLRSIIDLLLFRATNYPDNQITNKQNQVCILKKELTFKSIFESSIQPIWDYGKNDRLMQLEMKSMIQQLMETFPTSPLTQLLKEMYKDRKENEA